MINKVYVHFINEFLHLPAAKAGRDYYQVFSFKTVSEKAGTSKQDLTEIKNNS